MNLESHLDPLLRPKRVVIVGASPRRRMARTVLANLRQFGFSGAVWVLHPSGQPVEGYPCYRSIDALPQVPDCAVIALSPQNTLAVFRKLVRSGVRAAVIFGSGFAEAGEEGRQIQQEIVSLAQEYGTLVCGPNCLGLVTPDAGVTLTGYHLPDDLAPGPVAAVVQSGSVFWSLAHNTRGLRFRYLVSSGNEAVLTAADYFTAALTDPAVRLLIGFLETIRDGDHFLQVVQKAHERAIPVIVLKVGRSALGQAAALAHTGALAGSPEVVRDILRQYGVIQVDTLDELYDTAEFLLAGRWPTSPRLGVLTDSGGEKTLILDWAERLGLEFPEFSPTTATRLRQVLAPYVPVTNPLDAWGSGDFEVVYPTALQALADDPNIETVVLGTDMVRGTEEARLYAASMIELAQRTAKPLAVIPNQANGLDERVVQKLREAGIPVLQGTEYGYRTLARVIAYNQWRQYREPPSSPPEWLRSVQQYLAHQQGAQRTVLTEYEAKRLFRLIGLSTPPERLVTTLAEATVAAEVIGYPVVLKAHGPSLLHKSDVGAVRLHIRNQQELTAAWNELHDSLAEHPELTVTGYLVQKEVPAGLELLLACHYDQTFGMVVSLGLGGELVELLHDVVYHRAPVTLQQAHRMLEQLRANRLFHGYRRWPPRDRDAIVDAIVRMGWLAVAGANIVEVAEVNPLIALAEGQGCWAVDGLVVLGRSERG